MIAALDRAGLLEGYEEGDEPAPGLRLRSAPGHRVGHSILEIGASLVHAVDIVHHPLHVEHLEWDRTWDAEPEVALATRRAILSELAERLGLSRPTVHGLLQTLQAHGFVEQDRDSDKYQLGAGLLQLGNSYLDLNELRGRSIVHPT